MMEEEIFDKLALSSLQKHSVSSDTVASETG